MTLSHFIQEEDGLTAVNLDILPRIYILTLLVTLSHFKQEEDSLTAVNLNILPRIYILTIP